MGSSGRSPCPNPKQQLIRLFKLLISHPQDHFKRSQQVPTTKDEQQGANPKNIVVSAHNLPCTQSGLIVKYSTPRSVLPRDQILFPTIPCSSQDLGYTRSHYHHNRHPPAFHTPGSPQARELVCTTRTRRKSLNRCKKIKSKSMIYHINPSVRPCVRPSEAPQSLIPP